MTPHPALLSDHTEEQAKAFFHMALGGMASAVLAYNLLAYGCRRSPRLLANVFIYAALALLEAHQVAQHLKDAVHV